MPANSILDGSITALLSVLCILVELEVLSCALVKKVKSLNDFKFGTSVGRFLIDGAASTAVKGLNMLQMGFCCKIMSASCGCNLFYCWTCSSFTFVSCYCLLFLLLYVQNSKRILRSNEINVPPAGVFDTGLDLSFSLQVRLAVVLCHL